MYKTSLKIWKYEGNLRIRRQISESEAQSLNTDLRSEIWKSKSKIKIRIQNSKSKIEIQNRNSQICLQILRFASDFQIFEICFVLFSMNFNIFWRGLVQKKWLCSAQLCNTQLLFYNGFSIKNLIIDIFEFPLLVFKNVINAHTVKHNLYIYNVCDLL